MDARQERGLAIAAKCPVKRNRLGWAVPSQSGKGTYVVNMDGDAPFCTCPDFEARQQSCKHIYAVEFVIQREDNGDGTSTYTRTARVTYTQQWTAYNKAQTNEREQFVRLLRELCDGIPQPPQGKGRPRLPLGDVVFSLVGKVYSTMSGRRFTSDLRDAKAKGLVEKAPHYNSGFRYLDDAALTPLLKSLIEQSALPLSVIESDFAIDSTGFTSSVYDRWFDHKWGKMRKEARWVKAHIMTGVKTNIVTSVDVTPTETADAPFLTQLVNTTAEGFDISEVSADKAYSSRKNLHAIENVGAAPYIPFKARTNGIGNSPDALWHRMWAFYQFNRGEFLAHYHKRSNAETTMSMIKAKFGTRIRSKSPVAQVNEVLCKVLAHNICVLVQSVYELGLEPVFWTQEMEQNATVMR
jgi:transposase